MLEADSLYFDGPIQAQNCNYLSYRDFGLFCPECGGSVFLAGGEVQQPHFRHFKSKDGEEVCSHRVNSSHSNPLPLVRCDRHRKQREKILQQHFWNILKAAIPALALDEVQHEVATQWTGWKIHEDWIKGWQVAVRKGKLKPPVDEYMQAMFQGLLENANREEADYLVDYCSLLNQEVQRRTMYAITDFLALPQSKKFLLILFYYGLFDYTSRWEQNPKQFPAPLPPSVDRIYPWILANVLGILCVVPWAEAATAFQKEGCFVPRQEIRVRPGLATPTAPAPYQLWQPQLVRFKAVGFGK